ncbi:MAG: hypothetical protein HY319_14585 [Armatimonadetes bacterium]|nr:hypothetical protein [Armatimonadota bacterium]
MSAGAPTIFCIGFNKSGVKSLEQVFREQLGLRVCHDPRWTYWSQTGDRDRLGQFDAFVDGECANLGTLRSLVPGGRYILNTRGLRNWLVSRHRAVERSRYVMRWALKRALFPGGLPGWVRGPMNNGFPALERWVQIRNSYHAYVLDEFRDRPQELLILNLESESEAGFQALERFLGLKTPVEPVHRNRAGDSTSGGRVYAALRGNVDDWAESLEVVDGFLHKTGLDRFADSSVVIPLEEWRLPPNGVDRLLRWCPGLALLQRRSIRWACRWRQQARSIVGIYLADRLLGLCRSQSDLSAFVPVDRYASAST